jgi:ATP adenylyltransferase
MKTEVIQQYRRFDWVLKGLRHGPRSPFDIDLFSYDAVAVTPTVGALTAGWLLLVPRTAACCMSDLGTQLRRRVISIADEVRGAMKVFPGKTVLFEHGARRAGSATGCGVDQAHVHLVNMESDLMKSVVSGDPDFHWTQVNASDPWKEIDRDREYYLIADFSAAFVSYSVTGKSQYFRKAVAQELSRPTEWDYRLFANEQNARKTAKFLAATDRRQTAA